MTGNVSIAPSESSSGHMSVEPIIGRSPPSLKPNNAPISANLNDAGDYVRGVDYEESVEISSSDSDDDDSDSDLDSSVDGYT